MSFLSNVNNLEMIDTQAMATGTVTVAGTAAHVTRRTESGYAYFDIYNVAKDKLVVDYGTLETQASYYSTSPSAVQEPVVISPAPPASQQTPAASNEYDEVPKTGESPLIFWLLGISTLCMAGGCMLQKRR